MLFSGLTPGLSLAWLPVIIFVELLFLSGLSLMFAALNVHFRDIQHILNNFLTLWFFLCPILYSVSTIPEGFRPTIYFNPVALFTLMYHGVIMEGQSPQLSHLFLTSAAAILTFAIGNYIFNFYREGFAELV